MENCYRIVGGLGSPYSMKIRALFRYRRIPHIFEMRNGDIRKQVEHVKPQIIPMVQRPGDAAWLVDSTPIVYALEELHQDHRSVLPHDPGQRFLAELIEDFADEWLTKAMFHYRWYYATDADFSAYWIATDQITPSDDATTQRRAFAQQIAARQIERMPMVGCTEANKPVIETTYQRVLDALEPHVGFGQFLFGTRPSIADFGLFGQLKTLADDPTPQWLMRQRSPTVCHWVRQMDDLSGQSGDWLSPEQALPQVVCALLRLCGEAYLPFLRANAMALQAGDERVELSIFERPYAQVPFRYQAKCFSRLQHLYGALSTQDKAQIMPILDVTGCLDSLL
jgi:glutathione S-transferase